jgi:hypothetical protein
MLSSKIRTAVIHTTAVAALATPGAASAMIVKTKLAAPVAALTTHAVAAVKSAGSAGVPGYDDATCEALLNDYNTAVNHSEDELKSGKSSGTDYGQLANQIYGQLTSNCLVID